MSSGIYPFGHYTHATRATSSCQAGRVWRRFTDEDGSFVTLNPQYGATDEDVVVFPAYMTPNPTEGASIRFFLDTQVPHLMGGTSSAIRGGRTTGTAWDTANRGSDSVAFGLDGLASGAQSVVLGGDSGKATGVNSMAFGGGSAFGANSVAFGGSALGLRSFAFNDTASGDDSVVFAATGGFHVNGNGAGVPAATAGDIYLNAINVVCTGNVGIGNTSPALGLTIGSTSSRKTWSTFAYKDSANPYPPTLGLSQTIFSGIINSAGGPLYFYARNDTASYYYAISNSGTLFTGQHSGTGNPTLLKAGENEGLIVECDGTYVDKIEINNSWVNVKLTSTNKSPRVYGVISTHSAEEELSDENNVYKDHEQDNWGNDIHENQIRVNSLGEGAIWVSNLNGNFLNGDFIVSTTIKGYGGKQDDDILHNYTIGKVLSDCDFTNNNYKKRYLTSEGIQITENEYNENIHYIACFIGCVYYCG